MKVKSGKISKKPRHNPLISSDETFGLSAKKRDKFLKRQRLRDAKTERGVVDEKLSKRIIYEAKIQLEDEQLASGKRNSDKISGLSNNGVWDHRSGRHSSGVDLSARLDAVSDNDDISAMISGQLSDDEDSWDNHILQNDNDKDFQELQYDLDAISDNDRRALEIFMSKDTPARKNLADIIREKFQSKLSDELKDADMSFDSNDRPIIPDGLNEKVVEVYSKVGVLLSQYRSGKIPKAFKIISSLSNWEDVLYLTKPENWTPQALYQATRLFASNLKPKMAERYFNLVLLDRVRQDLEDTKKINYHVYMALKKAIYKPSAWFKGILFPLCESGCTLREATIISSVLRKVSIPVLHSSAALMKLAEMNYTGSNSIFMRVLLDKKYALPYRVIDTLVNHFMGFQNDEREMPVLWHQCLLVFCQRYKNDLSQAQRSNIVELTKNKSHHRISPEIRRELQYVTSMG